MDKNSIFSFIKYILSFIKISRQERQKVEKDKIQLRSLKLTKS